MVFSELQKIRENPISASDSHGFAFKKRTLLDHAAPSGVEGACFA